MPASAEPAVRSRLSAFGLAIASEVEILGAAGPPEPGLPAVRLCERPADPRSRDGGKIVLERHWRDGSLGMRVRRLPDDGFVVEAPGHGEFLLCPGGEEALLLGLHGPPSHWHRPLLGQVLPLLSVLNGYETLHASAVVIDGAAVAISAPSNMGKSSLMIHLVDRGGRLLGDDVVALRPDGEELIAHPGSTLANLSVEQHAALRPATRRALGPPVGDGDKRTFAVGSMRGGSAPLRAFITLQRSTRLTRLTLTRDPAPDPTQLLAATFLPHVVTPRRLRVQFEVCARLADGVPVLRLQAPAAIAARELAEVVERELRAIASAESSRPTRDHDVAS